MHQLQDSGTFSDLGKLKSLIAVARKDVVLSAGWDEEQFQRMAALAGGDVEFRTLPVVRYDEIDGQDVNIIDSAAIKAEIAAAIGDTTSTTAVESTTVPPNPTTVVDVVNAGSVSGLATQVSRTLKQHGYTIGEVRDRTAADPTTMAVAYGPGMATDAQNLARLLGIDAPAQQVSAVKAGHIEVVVDDNYSASSQDDTSTTTTTTLHPSRTTGQPLRCPPRTGARRSSTAAGCPASTDSQACVPPSIRISVPVMNAPSSDTSMATTPATAAGSPIPAPLDSKVVGKMGDSLPNSAQSASAGM